MIRKTLAPVVAAATFAGLGCTPQPGEGVEFIDEVHAGSISEIDDVIFDQAEDGFEGPNRQTDLMMNIKLPNTSEHEELPVAIAVFGGGWCEGDRTQQEAVVRELAERGYLAASIDYEYLPDPQNNCPYGVASEEVYKASMDRTSRRAMDAVAFLDQNAQAITGKKIDTSRILTVGWSAGATSLFTSIRDGKTNDIHRPDVIVGYSGFMPLENLAPEGVANFTGHVLMKSFNPDIGFVGVEANAAADCQDINQAIPRQLGDKACTFVSLPIPGVNIPGHDYDPALDASEIATFSYAKLDIANLD